MPSENPPARRCATELSPTSSSSWSTRRPETRAAAASIRRWLRALRRGWNALASSMAPTTRIGQASSR